MADLLQSLHAYRSCTHILTAFSPSDLQTEQTASQVWLFIVPLQCHQLVCSRVCTNATRPTGLSRAGFCFFPPFHLSRQPMQMSSRAPHATHMRADFAVDAGRRLTLKRACLQTKQRGSARKCVQKSSPKGLKPGRNPEGESFLAETTRPEVRERMAFLSVSTTLLLFHVNRVIFVPHGCRSPAWNVSRPGETPPPRLLL